MQRKAESSNKKLPYRLQQRLFIALVLVGDVVFVGLAFFLAYLLRFDANIELFKMVVKPNSLSYFHMGLALIPLWIVLFWMYRLNEWNQPVAAEWG